MSNINVIRIYNLVNPKGTRLQLRLGVLPLKDREEYCGDTGYRWSFCGKEIPMPVRSETWFNGFPADTMRLWLAEHEWNVETEIDMRTSRVKVYELPEPVEEYDAKTLAEDGLVFNAHLKELNAQGRFGVAMQLYSYAHEVGHWTAREAVREICKA